MAWILLVHDVSLHRRALGEEHGLRRGVDYLLPFGHAGRRPPLAVLTDLVEGPGADRHSADAKCVAARTPLLEFGPDGLLVQVQEVAQASSMQI